MLRDDKGKHEAVSEEDLAEERILVINVSIWLPNAAVIPENRPRPARSWLRTKFFALSGYDIIDKNRRKAFFLFLFKTDVNKNIPNHSAEIQQILTKFCRVYYKMNTNIICLYK